MPPYVTFFAMPLIGFLLGIWCASIMIHDLYKAAVGSYITELEKLKTTCESKLPRNQVCIGSVVFTPKAIGEDQ